MKCKNTTQSMNNLTVNDNQNDLSDEEISAIHSCSTKSIEKTDGVNSSKSDDFMRLLHSLLFISIRSHRWDSKLPQLRLWMNP